MSWRGLGPFPSPRSLMGLHGRGPCPLPYRPICSTHCREKGRFTPNPAAALHSVSFPRAIPAMCALTGLTPDKTNRQRQTDKQTDRQPDRQTDKANRDKKNKNTRCLALPVWDRGHFTLPWSLRLVSKLPVKPNLYWRFMGQAASRAISP